MLDEKSFSQMGFPIILQKKLLEKIELLKGGSSEAQPNVAQQSVDNLLNDLYKQVFGSSNLIVTMQTLHMILGNLIQNPEEQKYKKINLANPKIADKIARYPPAVALLELAGFVPQEINHLVFPAVSPQLLANLKFIVSLIEGFGNRIGKL